MINICNNDFQKERVKREIKTDCYSIYHKREYRSTPIVFFDPSCSTKALFPTNLWGFYKNSRENWHLPVDVRRTQNGYGVTVSPTVDKFDRKEW